MKAAILSTGDELVVGKSIDTNSHWLINQLTEMDVEVACYLMVGDNRDSIVWALKQAMTHASLVIMTGGLGPTDDDLTRFALAELAGVELFEHDESVERIRAFFESRSRPMNERNRIQGMMPQGAEALDNPSGTAPGIRIEIGPSTIVALPGVPREMKEMFDLYVRPWVLERSRPVFYRRRLHCVGIGESDLVHQINDLVKACPDVVFGTTANEGIISISMVCKQKELVEQLEESIRQRLGGLVFGKDQETLATVVGELLRQRGQTLAVAESCTGGLIGKMITDIPGSSGFFVGGFICYSNELKESLAKVPHELIVEHGAVSEPVVAALARGTRKKTGADWAIAVTGIAGPGGGTDEKPVGLVYIAVAGPQDILETRELRIGNPGRDAIRFRSAIWTLDLLRKMILNEKNTLMG